MDPRTYLFVPGNRPERFAKALGTGADAIVLDLEDAVSPTAKTQARDAVLEWFRLATDPVRSRTVVRINDSRSSEFAEDLRLLRDARVGMVMLPKAEAADDVQLVRSDCVDVRVLALIETARGMSRVDEVAASEGVARLVFGTLDYAVDLDLEIADSPMGLAHGASVIALASRVAGLPPPVAGVTPQIDDDQRLLADLTWARRHGFGAKLCIHPRQVEPLHQALSPGAEALDWARRVLAAEAASPGAAQLDGRMIDRPVVLQAQRTLQRGTP
jgi:citrate lyase subunit beta/citryl-CoA lyase